SRRRRATSGTSAICARSSSRTCPSRIPVRSRRRSTRTCWRSCSRRTAIPRARGRSRRRIRRRSHAFRSVRSPARSRRTRRRAPARFADASRVTIGTVRAELEAAPPLAAETSVAEIDPQLADTAAFCERYGVRLDESANCVVLAARREGRAWYVACMILATARVDVNGVVKKHLGASKLSFASMDDATAATGMEYGGITPIGLPPEWPLLVDSAVVATARVVVGSG